MTAPPCHTPTPPGDSGVGTAVARLMVFGTVALGAVACGEIGPASTGGQVPAVAPPSPERLSAYGFPAPAEPLPCGLEVPFGRAAHTYWRTQLPEAGASFDSIAFALSECPGATPLHAARVHLASALVEQRGYNQLRAMTYVGACLDSLAVVGEAAAPEIAAEAYTLKALLHEVSEQGPEAFDALAEAGRLVREYGLRDARSTYYLRAASVNRFYGDRGLGYRLADSAWRAASDNGRIRDQTDAIFLRTSLHPDPTPARRLRGYHQAARLFRAAGTADGEAHMLLNVARVYLLDGGTDRAIAAIDSAAALTRAARRGGYATEALTTRLHDAYAEVYRATAQYDSAFARLSKARASELAYAYDNRNSEVLRLGRQRDREAALASLAAERAFTGAERAGKRRFALAAVALACLSIGLAVAVFLLERARRRVREESDRQATLRDELQHRVKNNFQILISFLENQAERSLGSEAAAFTQMARRVHNLAQIHAHLHDRAPGADARALRPYLAHLIAAFRGLLPEADLLRIHLEGEAASPPPRYLSAIGIILNELLTNSAKHAGATADSPVDVSVTISRRGDTLLFAYADNGSGFVAAARDLTRRASHGRIAGGDSLGTFLISAMVRQLDGVIEAVSDSAHGLRLQFLIPLTDEAIAEAVAGEPSPSPARAIDLAPATSLQDA